MKTFFQKFTIALILASAIISCKKNSDLFVYDTSEASLYFEYKFNTTQGSISNGIGIDSLVFSFVSVPLDDETYTFKVPVLVSGVAKDYDRKYNVEVVDSLTSLTAEYYTIKDPVIRKGKHIDTLEVTVKKHQALQSTTKQIGIRLKESDEFGVGYKNNQTIRLQVSNILLKPTWWTTWQGVFGPYSQEKYQMWAMIYHEKADGYLNYLYSYKNMPTIAIAAYYPTTFVFIQQLKQYFVDNIVYEGGNPENPRVSIPYQF